MIFRIIWGKGITGTIRSSREIIRCYSSRSIPTPPNLSELTPTDMAAVRDWAANFKTVSIPRHAVEMSFSRSSGPGGQNVNKVNTKATVRCPLSAKWIPLWAHDRLRQSTSFVASTRSLLITSSTHRSQAQNVEECLSKLHAVVLEASLAAVKNEPSEVQKERVRTLEKISNSRRIGVKKYKSQIKKSRSKGNWE